jgi:hypothetical protein
MKITPRVTKNTPRVFGYTFGVLKLDKYAYQYKQSGEQERGNSAVPLIF